MSTLLGARKTWFFWICRSFLVLRARYAVCCSSKGLFLWIVTIKFHFISRYRSSRVQSIPGQFEQFQIGFVCVCVCMMMSNVSWLVRMWLMPYSSSTERSPENEYTRGKWQAEEVRRKNSQKARDPFFWFFSTSRTWRVAVNMLLWLVGWVIKKSCSDPRTLPVEENCAHGTWSFRCAVPPPVAEGFESESRQRTLDSSSTLDSCPSFLTKVWRLTSLNCRRMTRSLNLLGSTALANGQLSHLIWMVELENNAGNGGIIIWTQTSRREAGALKRNVS